MKLIKDSIRELSTRYEEFAHRAIDFLVDMFNDEIDSVRINAILSMRSLGDRVKLSEEQLLTVLSSLEDSSSEVREAIHLLLHSISLVSIPSLHATIQVRRS